MSRDALIEELEWAVLGATRTGDTKRVKKAREALSAALAAPAQDAGVQLAPSRVGRVYLAGPMTGYVDWNFPAFNAAAASLRANGAEVVNPAEHGIVEGAEWADYLRFDIAKIAICESIALLPGWSKSRGAVLEVYVARALGMPLQFLPGAEQPVAPALTEHEQRAILRHPVAIACLIGHHDCEEAGADAAEPGLGSYHAKRVLELLAIGRAVIAEDPEIWPEEERKEFALRYSERTAQGATHGN